MKRISCIIPAYNEEHGIDQTLAVVTPLIGSHLLEVIVVDDGSKDATREIVQRYPSATLIIHDVNKGKSKTIYDGIMSSKGDYVFFLDADLKHLDQQNIADLIAPIEAEKADFAISYRKNAWPLFPFKKIDYLSGERILPRALLEPSLPDMAKLPSYGLEVFLNRIVIRNQLRIAVVKWPNVENDMKQTRRGGTLMSIWVALKIWKDVISTISIFEMYGQNIKLRKLLV